MVLNFILLLNLILSDEHNIQKRHHINNVNIQHNHSHLHLFPTLVFHKHEHEHHSNIFFHNHEHNDNNIEVIPVSQPTSSPTLSPSTIPTLSPSTIPTLSPTSSPSTIPTSSPSTIPTSSPTLLPTLSPSISPTIFETGFNSENLSVNLDESKESKAGFNNNYLIFSISGLILIVLVIVFLKKRYNVKKEPNNTQVENVYEEPVENVYEEPVEINKENNYDIAENTYGESFDRVNYNSSYEISSDYSELNIGSFNKSEYDVSQTNFYEEV